MPSQETSDGEVQEAFGVGLTDGALRRWLVAVLMYQRLDDGVLTQTAGNT